MILKELSTAIGISGKEDAVRKIILDAIKDHVDDIQIDALGTVTALKKGKDSKRPKVMLAAHMDEIGFMVTGIESNGLIRFTNIGGVDDRILPGLRVKIGDDHIAGVIIWTPIHQNYDQNVVKIKTLRIDIGASEKNGKVKAGDRIAFDSQFMEIGDKILRGKAFDDRVGCAVLVDILQGKSYKSDIMAAFTVQEEIGLRGAKVAAQKLNPDVAFILEGTTAHDVPNPMAEADDDDEVNPATKLGAGPALTVMDKSMITNPRLLKFMRETADKKKIPYQLKTALGGGTDAGRIHIANAGILSGVISVPCRYIHSPTAYLHRDDYDNTVKLVKAYVNSITFDHLKQE